MTLIRFEEPIAIIGMSCRLPGASDPEAFWTLVEQGGVAVGPVPESRWRLSEAFRSTPELAAASHAWRGGFLEGVTDFDWRAMRLLPREAKALDPQHRLMLELAWEALEDAGIPVVGPRKEKTGVYVGIQWNDFFRLISRDWCQLDGYSVIGNDLLFASNRISFMLDLPGPSVSLDAGCASGLVALQQGCRALWSGDADQVVVGAVDLMLSPDSQIAMAGTGMLSKQGACRPLDASADGFVRGEGGVVLVMKRQSRVAPHERVHALIRGAASAHSGRNEWIMASSETTQAAVIRSACEQAAMSPATLDYVELHGTGSQRGDPVELRALNETVGTGRAPDAPACAIGSVKAQIGHLGPVAGLAGLMKVVLGIRHQRYPRSLKPETVNPALALESTGLTLDRAGEPWEVAPGARRRAGVTALSLGGLAAHVVLEEPQARVEAQLPSTAPPHEFLLPLSARSNEALVCLALAYAAVLDRTTDLEALVDLCFTAGAGRAHHDFRLVVCGKSSSVLAKRLRDEAHRLNEAPGKARLHEQAAVVLVGPFDSAMADVCAAAGLTVVDAVAGGANLTGLAKTPLAVLVASEAKDTCGKLVEELESAGAMPDVFVLSDTAGNSAPMAFWAWVYLKGGSPDFASLTPGGRICTTPTYPWQRQPAWPTWLTPEFIGTPPEANGRRRAAQDAHPVLGRHMELAATPGAHLWHTTVQSMMDAFGDDGGALPLHAIACAATEAAGLPQQTFACREVVAAPPITASTHVQVSLRRVENTDTTVVDVFLRGEVGGWTHVSELVATSIDAEQSSDLQEVIRDELSAAAPAEARQCLRKWVDSVLLRVLQPEDRIVPGGQVALIAIGLDSISAAEIRTLAQRDLLLDLPVASVFDAATPEGLCEELLRRFLTRRLLDIATTQTGESLDQQPEDQETWTL